MSEIVKRLLAKGNDWSETELRNPDGPEAVTELNRLVELSARLAAETTRLTTALENAREEAAKKVEALKEHTFAHCKYILPKEHLKCQHERWHGYCPCDEQAAILNKAATLIRSLTPPKEKAS